MHAPSIATYRRPMRSEREPTKGQMDAKARRLAKTCQTISAQATMNLNVWQTHKPCPSVDAANVAGEKN